MSKAWLDRYSGEQAGQLVEMSARYSIPSILVAFEDALQAKAARAGLESLNETEITVLAVEVVERYVNDGGFRSLLAHAPEIVPHAGGAFRRIGCSGLAGIVDRAIEIRESEGRFEPSQFYAEPIGARISWVLKRLDRECDQPFMALRHGQGAELTFWSGPEDADQRLFSFIERNQGQIILP